MPKGFLLPSQTSLAFTAVFCFSNIKFDPKCIIGMFLLFNDDKSLAGGNH